MPAGRRGGRGPQAGHGADAAPGRRTMPGRPDLAHSMTTSGPGRPLTRRRVTAGWIARQPARSWASDGTSGPCRVVARGPCARNDPAGRRPSRRSRTRVEGRTNWAAGRAAYLAAMLWSMGGYGTGSGWACKAVASTARIFVASSGASAPRASARSISRPAAATYSGDHARCVAAQRLEVRLERPDVAPRHRPGEGRPDAEGAGVAERPLDERAVDRQRPGFVETGHPAELGDGVEQRDEPAGGQDRRGMVGGLRARGEPDRHATQRLGHPGEHGGQLIVALDRDRGAVERLDGTLRVGERDQRMERPDLGAGRHGRGEDLGPERTAGVDHRLAAVHPERPGERRDRVVGHGQDDQLDLIEDRLRIGEDAADVDQRAEPLAPARDPGSPPRGPASRLELSATPSAVPTAPAPTIPMTGVSPGSEWTCGWAWSLGWVASPWRWKPGGVGSRSMPASAMAACFSARSRSGSSPGRSPQAFIGAPPPAIVGGRRTCIRRV